MEKWTAFAGREGEKICSAVVEIRRLSWNNELWWSESFPGDNKLGTVFWVFQNNNKGLSNPIWITTVNLYGVDAGLLTAAVRFRSSLSVCPVAGTWGSAVWLDPDAEPLFWAAGGVGSGTGSFLSGWSVWKAGIPRERHRSWLSILAVTPQGERDQGRFCYKLEKEIHLLPS